MESGWEEEGSADGGRVRLPSRRRRGSLGARMCDQEDSCDQSPRWWGRLPPISTTVGVTCAGHREPGWLRLRDSRFSFAPSMNNMLTFAERALEV